MKEKPLICFDLDGTLIDNTKTHLNAFQYAFKKNNLAIPHEKEILKVFGQGKRAVIRMLLRNYIPEERFQHLLDEYTNYLIKHPEEMKIIRGVIPALERLKTKFCIGLISNNTHENILEILEGVRFPIKIFDVIIGEDDVDAPKPSPNIILKAEQILATHAEYIVGDSTYDLKAGHNAKCKTIAVLTGIHDFKKLWAEKPTIITDSVADLPGLLLK